MASGYKKADTAGIDKLISWISANPIESMIPSRMIAKAQELGYDPEDLIDSALGSVKLEKSGARLSEDVVDILNKVYEKNPTPGKRFVMDPSEAISKKGKEVAESLGKNLGVAQSLNIGKSRSLPEYIVVKKPYTEEDKLKSITVAGHELKHPEDWLIRPDFEIKNQKAYTKGHHYGDIYETSELNREVRNLPEDTRIRDEIIKQSKKRGLSPSEFRRLFSQIGPIGSALGAGLALKSGDTLGAALELGSLADPTGVIDAVSELRDRVKLEDPKEIRKVIREDKYSGMGHALSPADIMLDQLEDIEEDENLDVKKEYEKTKYKLGYK